MRFVRSSSSWAFTALGHLQLLGGIYAATFSAVSFPRPVGNSMGLEWVRPLRAGSPAGHDLSRRWPDDVGVGETL